MSDENLTVNEDLPSWPEIQEHPDYINASPEDKLESFNRWRDVWTESFGNDLNVIEHPEVRNFFNITKSYELQLKKDALAGEESPWEDGAMLDDFHAYQKGRGRVAELRAAKTWNLDNAFNLHNKDIKPYEQRKPPVGVLSSVRSALGNVDMPGQDAKGNKEEEYEIGSEQDYSDGYRFYDGDVKKSVVLNPSAREWLKKNVESREDGSFSWVARDIGSFSDVKEINLFRSVLGADEFSEGLSQAEILNAREKAEALGEYPIHRQLAISRFKQYLTSRKQEGTQIPETPPTGMQKFLNMLNQGASMGPSGPMLSRGAPVDYVFKSNNLGDSEIYTRNAPWFHLANEKSHLMKKVRENRVLENPDILTDPDKYKKLFSDYNDLESLAPHKFIADYFLPKVGMEDVVNEIRDEGPKSEAYKQSLTDLMFDALLEMPAAWAEDMVVVERDGDYIVNPELYNTASEKELDQKLKDAGLDETERLLHTNIAANVQEEIAERQHYALLAGKSVSNAIKGAEQDYGQGEIDLAERLVNLVLDPMNGPYRTYLASLDRKGIKVTYKEAIDGFRDRLENPTDSENFAEFLSYASRSKTPLGGFGQVLQTLENHDTIAGWGVGMQKAEEAALRELPMFAAGLYGIGETIFSDKDDTLRGINEFQSMLESQRAASGHPTGAKWGNIFGREIAYIALAKAVPGGGYTRMVEKGTSTLGRSIGSVRAAGARFIGGIKGTDQVKKLGLKVQQKFSHGATKSGKSLKADFFSKLPAKAYFTMQASRSGEAMYRESFLAHKQRLIDNGATAEEAHSFAGTLAAPTGILGALITGTLMKVIPGGTERLFEKGINKLTKPELLKALNISDKVYRAQLSDVTFRRQSRELLGDWFRVGQTEGSRKLVGRGLRGLRHLGKEAAEESIDEIFQGIIAMQTYDPDMTFEEVLSHAWDAAIAGGVLGGTMGLAASSPNEGVQGLSEVQRVQLNDLRNRSRELGANPDTQLTSEALDEVEKTLNAKYNVDNAAAAEEAAETADVVPDETSTPDKPSTTRDLVEGQPIFYILGDAFNEDGSFEVKEGIYERQEIGGAPVEVIFDPSAPENSPERVRPLRDTLGYSSRRDEMDAGTFAEGNAP